MKIPFKLTGYVLFALIFSIPLLAQTLEETAPANVGISAERLERLDNVLGGFVEQNSLAGGVALIARRGKIAYHKAFGWRDKEAGAAMNTDSMFRIASQTKALTSVGIMVLQEQGKLLITDPLSKYLPEFENTTVAVAGDNESYETVDAKRAITLRDLLTHTAGIDYGFGPGKEAWKQADMQGWYFAHRDEPIRQTVARIAKLPQAAQPGESFVYGYNTDILGAVIEVVSGQPLDRFLSQNILEPLRMNDTCFYVPPAKKDRLAVVYSSGERGIERAPDPGDFQGMSHIGQGHYVEGPRQSFSGGAGLVSTAKDYATFLQMLLNGGELNGRRILSRKSVELMTVDHIDGIQLPWSGPGVGFGLGFMITEDIGKRGMLGSVGSYSWGGAYHSSYWVDPAEQLVVVYLTQLIPATDIDDHNKLKALVYQAIVD